MMTNAILTICMLAVTVSGLLNVTNLENSLIAVGNVDAFVLDVEVGQTAQKTTARLLNVTNLEHSLITVGNVDALVLDVKEAEEET
ncbi:hypothetical protein CHS0354_040758 [Potamilus streckersoni]|uniref:Uncharacterized protein n=1 Tax=Potamilus streckersoni TaxID=2493646 RepID=A0AAE0SLN5_9BIVA|nr:hypothetical protein CHS0354_040758 [Potamilus streckersoni]